MTSTSRLSLVLACLSAFAFATVETSSYLVLPPLLVNTYGYETSAVGVLMAIVGAASLAARFPVGAWYGAGHGYGLALVGGLAGVFAMLALGNPAGLGVLLVALIGLGTTISVASTLQLATLTALGDGQRLGSAIGWYTACLGIGHAVTGVGAGWIGDRFGIPAVYAYAAGATMVGTLLWLAAERLALREHPRVVPQPAKGAEAVPRQARRSFAAWFAERRTDWDAPLVAAFVLVLVMNTYNASVSTFHPIMAIGAGLTLAQVGLLTSFRSIASTAVRVGAGLFLRKTNGERLIWPLILLGSVAIAALPTLRGSAFAQVPLFLGMGVSRGLLRVTGSSVAMGGRESSEARGRASATINAGLDLGKLAGPLIGSGLVAVAGLDGMFPVLAVAGLVSYWLAARRLP